MKIFVITLLAATTALAMADISFQSGYNYNSNNNVPQAYYKQQQNSHQPQQQQYTNQNIIPNTFFKPNIQYLPQPQNEPQQPQIENHLQLQHKFLHVPSQQQPQQPFAMKFPMPNDFPSMMNSHKPVVKPAERYRPRVRIPKKTIVTNSFYIHSAPEETEAELDEELATLQQQRRKHYNVLFVKTPSQTNKAAALNLIRDLKEEKTVVYVLTKKTSAADLQDVVQESPQHNSKPEVFFIKYRTPEEAANAQREIQLQYERLGGFTTIPDEGVAPPTSVNGSLHATDDDEEEKVEEDQQQRQLLDNAQEYVHPSDHYEKQQLLNSFASSSNNGYLPPAN